MSILRDILKGVSISKSILICDSADQSGEEITLALLKKHETSGSKVLHIKFDDTDRKCLLNLTNAVVHKDIVKNPSDWLQPENFKFDARSLVEELGTKAVVLISSLTSALLKIEAHDIFVELSKLKEHESVVQIICQIHLDVVSSSEFSLLKSLFSTIIHVEPPANTKVPSYNMQHYKPNGKYYTEERLFYNEDGVLKIQPLTNPEPTKSVSSESVSKPVHDTFSTFRHGLNADEQKARENLVLPFQRVTLDGLPPRGHGKIEYEPEEDDEWDEEDPDDDLEI